VTCDHVRCECGATVSVHRLAFHRASRRHATLLAGERPCSNCRHRPAISGRTRCERCVERERERVRAWRRRAEERGHCVRVGCEAPRAAGSKRCERHRAIANGANRKARERARRDGLCVDCHRRRTLEGYTRCYACRVRGKIRERAPRRRAQIEGYKRRRRDAVIGRACRSCGRTDAEVRWHNGPNDLCRACYVRARRNGTCAVCGAALYRNGCRRCAEKRRKR